MKAVLLTKPGAMRLGTLLRPQLKPGQALIHVKACALNYLDVLVARGRLAVPLPHVSGSDITGVVEAVDGKSPLRVGQEVVVNPSFPCGTCALCQQGEPCQTVNILGYHIPGGLAEFVAVPLAQVYPKPSQLSFAEAAAFPLTFLTAYHMLVGRAQLQAGETVFVWGASGGLGAAAIQIAKQRKATVIAAAKTAADAQKIKQLGADHVLIYTRKSLVNEVQRLTGGGAHVVFECVGAATWERTLAMLRPHGRVVIAGTVSGDVASQDLSELYYRQLTILGARMGSAEEFAQVLALVSVGKLKPVVDSVFPLEDFPAALTRLEQSQQVGKIVLEL